MASLSDEPEILKVLNSSVPSSFTSGYVEIEIRFRKYQRNSFPITISSVIFYRIINLLNNFRENGDIDNSYQTQNRELIWNIENNRRLRKISQNGEQYYSIKTELGVHTSYEPFSYKIIKSYEQDVPNKTPSTGPDIIREKLRDRYEPNNLFLNGGFENWRIDLTQVRETKKNITKTFTNYEVEIEYVGADISTINFGTIMKIIMKTQAILQGGNRIMTISTQNLINKTFNELFFPQFREIRKNAEIVSLSNKFFTSFTEFINVSEEQLKRIENKILREWNDLTKNKMYMGINKPINLTRSGLLKLNEYATTYKVDGTRRFLFFHREGIFEIWPPYEIRSVEVNGITFSNLEILHGTLVDGELISDLMENLLDSKIKKINGKSNYQMFDILFASKKIIKETLKIVQPKDKFQFLSNPGIEIGGITIPKFESSQEIIDVRNLPLIYSLTQTNTGISRFDIMKTLLKYIGDITIKKYIFPQLQKPDTWIIWNRIETAIKIFKRLNDNWENKNEGLPVDGIILQPMHSSYNIGEIYKWKPIDKLSIDFKIVFIEANKIELYSWIKGNNRIFTGTKEHPFSFVEVSEETIDKLNLATGQVVEFKWDTENELMYPYRVRYDREHPNGYNVAISTYNEFYSPLTEDDISGKTLMIMRAYHNDIKNRLLEEATKITNKSANRVLDIGSGRGGDINKWIKHKFSRIYALEPNNTNLTEFIKRLKSIKQETPFIEDATTVRKLALPREYSNLIIPTNLLNNEEIIDLLRKKILQNLISTREITNDINLLRKQLKNAGLGISSTKFKELTEQAVKKILIREVSNRINKEVFHLSLKELQQYQKNFDIKITQIQKEKERIPLEIEYIKNLLKRRNLTTEELLEEAKKQDIKISKEQLDKEKANFSITVQDYIKEKFAFSGPIYEHNNLIYNLKSDKEVDATQFLNDILLKIKKDPTSAIIPIESTIEDLVLENVHSLNINDFPQEEGVDLVISFFSFTFMFENAKKLRKAISVINNVLKPGGRFIGIAMDGDLVYKEIVNNKGKLEDDGWKIEQKFKNIKNSLQEDPWGKNIFINFNDKTSMIKNLEEPLLSFEILKKELEKTGFAKSEGLYRYRDYIHEEMLTEFDEIELAKLKLEINQTVTDQARKLAREVLGPNALLEEIDNLASNIDPQFYSLDSNILPNSTRKLSKYYKTFNYVKKPLEGPIDMIKNISKDEQSLNRLLSLPKEEYTIEELQFLTNKVRARNEEISKYFMLSDDRDLQDNYNEIVNVIKKKNLLETRLNMTNNIMKKKGTISFNSINFGNLIIDNKITIETLKSIISNRLQNLNLSLDEFDEAFKNITKAFRTKINKQNNLQRRLNDLLTELENARTDVMLSLEAELIKIEEKTTKKEFFEILDRKILYKALALSPSFSPIVNSLFIKQNQSIKLIKTDFELTEKGLEQVIKDVTNEILINKDISENLRLTLKKYINSLKDLSNIAKQWNLSIQNFNKAIETFQKEKEDISKEISEIKKDISENNLIEKFRSFTMIFNLLEILRLYPDWKKLNEKLIDLRKERYAIIERRTQTKDIMLRFEKMKFQLKQLENNLCNKVEIERLKQEISLLKSHLSTILPQNEFLELQELSNELNKLQNIENPTSTQIKRLKMITNKINDNQHIIRKYNKIHSMYLNSVSSLKNLIELPKPLNPKEQQRFYELNAKIRAYEIELEKYAIGLGRAVSSEDWRETKNEIRLNIINKLINLTKSDRRKQELINAKKKIEQWFKLKEEENILIKTDEFKKLGATKKNEFLRAFNLAINNLNKEIVNALSQVNLNFSIQTVIDPKTNDVVVNAVNNSTNEIEFRVILPTQKKVTDYTFSLLEQADSIIGKNDTMEITAIGKKSEKKRQNIVDEVTDSGPLANSTQKSFEDNTIRIQTFNRYKIEKSNSENNITDVEAIKNFEKIHDKIKNIKENRLKQNVNLTIQDIQQNINERTKTKNKLIRQLKILKTEILKIPKPKQKSSLELKTFINLKLQLEDISNKLNQLKEYNKLNINNSRKKVVCIESNKIFKFTIVNLPTPGDGNCLIYALLMSLYPNKYLPFKNSVDKKKRNNPLYEDMIKIRKKIIIAIKNDRKENINIENTRYREIYSATTKRKKGESDKDYLERGFIILEKKLRTSGCWLDTTMLDLLSDVLKKNILVISQMTNDFKQFLSKQKRKQFENCNIIATKTTKKEYRDFVFIYNDIGGGKGIHFEALKVLPAKSGLITEQMSFENPRIAKIYFYMKEFTEI